VQSDSRPVLDEGQPIHRFSVSVNDRWCRIAAGPPLHVGSRRHGVVEFWAWPAAETHNYMVIGTGQPAPTPVIYWGTALDPGGLVWHLVERVGGDAGPAEHVVPVPGTQAR
jgi:hypothetical protein